MIPSDDEAKILRLHHAEKWPPGTIARQSDVEEVLDLDERARALLPRADQVRIRVSTARLLLDDDPSMARSLLLGAAGVGVLRRLVTRVLDHGLIGATRRGRLHSRGEKCVVCSNDSNEWTQRAIGRITDGIAARTGQFGEEPK